MGSNDLSAEDFADLEHAFNVVAQDTLKSQLDQDRQEIEKGWEIVLEENLEKKTKTSASSLMQSGIYEDKSDDLEFRLPKESITGYKTQSFMIHPSHPVKIKFDLAIGALIMYSIIAVPFRIGFGVEDSLGLIVSDAIVDSLFGIDIIATFRTAYFNDELVGFETNPWKVASRYIGDFFFIDLISTFPFALLGDIIPSSSSLFSSSKLLRILRLARLIKLVRVLKLSDKSSLENDPKLHPSLSALLQMIAVLLFIAHLLACLWYMILDESKDVNWLNKFGGQADFSSRLTLSEKYVISLYWAFTTMSTVGYGDIVATNQTEYVVSVFGMLIGATMFGYVIGNVSGMMDTFDPEGAQFDDNMDRISSFVLDRTLPFELGQRLKTHFKSQYSRTTVFESTSEEVVASLPAPTSCATVYSEFKHIISVMPHLRDNDPTYVKGFVKVMHWFSAAPDDVISKESDLGLCLFLIEKGSVRQMIEKKEGSSEIFDTLSAGSMFGEAPVILNSEHYVTTIASTACDIWFVSKENLSELLASCPSQSSQLARCGVQFLERVAKHLDVEVKDLMPHSNIDLTVQSPKLIHVEPDEFLLAVLPFDRKAEKMKRLSFRAGDLQQLDSPKGDVEMVNRLGVSDTSSSFQQEQSIESSKSNILLNGLFHPDAPLKMAWDFFICFIILYSVVTLSYQLGFKIEFSGSMALFDWMVDILFALDIMVTFNTAIIDSDGELIIDRYFITRHYLKGWFALDFISTVPFVALFELMNLGKNPVIASLPLIRSLRLVRLFKIARIIAMSGIMDTLTNWGVPASSMRLCKLLVIMLFFAHLLACMLYAVADCQSGSCWMENYCLGGNNWFGDDYKAGDDDGAVCLLNESPDVRYLATFYWAFATMTTIGYGDISPDPNSVNEIALTIVAQVLGTTLFAYVIGALIHLIMDFDPGRRMRTQNLLFLNQYLTDFRCTLAFRRCMRSHFLFREKVKSVFDENQLLALMPPAVRFEVIDHINGRSMRNFPVLVGLENQMRGCFSVILPKLNPYCYRAGDVVFHPMLGTHREMMFVQTGEVSSHKWRPVMSKKKSFSAAAGGGGLLDGNGAAFMTTNKDSQKYFGLQVEVIATSTSEVFGLTRPNFQLLESHYPSLTDKLKEALRVSFESSMEWVNITSSVSTKETVMEEIWPSNN